MLATITTPYALCSCSMQSNNPCEDRIIVESPIPGMLVAGVADGHGGTFVSDVIKMEMGSMVKRIFGDIRSSR